MGYRLRLHREIRDWLTDLRGSEPELARRVGEAVVALLDAGERLGPPLVVPLESMFRPPDDPREALDDSYQRQLEALQRVRRGVADVATSRKRVELQVGQLEETAARLAGGRRDALDSGDEDLAGDVRAQVQEQLSGLRGRLSVMKNEEEELTAASQRLQARVDAFRTRKETLKARYTANEASRSVREAFAALGEDASDLDLPQPEPPHPAGVQPPEVSEILDAIANLTGTPADGTWPTDRGSIPAGMMELRPGAPDDVEVGLLFVAEPADTAVMVAWVDDPGGPLAEYREVIPVAADRLEAARPAPSASASAARFVAYDTESFLDEFFPGAETEVEVGAAALAARSRAHALAEARQRMGLSQTQMAMRMNIRQERVAAIERAEPGATEVRTLAAYVQALGGTLEIIASIGDERIVLALGLKSVPGPARDAQARGDVIGGVVVARHGRGGGPGEVVVQYLPDRVGRVQADVC
jgi:DNA-binding XRE family transcriptional regulator